MSLNPFRSPRAALGTSLAAVLLASCSVSIGATGTARASPQGRQAAAAQRASHDPAANSLADRAIAAMKTVSSMHATGIWGAARVAFTGDCVTAGPRAFISFHSSYVSWQLIFISRPVQRDWERYRRGAAPWGKWQPQATGPGDFNFPLLLPLACPRVSLHDWRLNKVTLRFQIAGTTLVGGRQTWHLHAAVKEARTVVDWYVDKSTYKLRRRRFAQYSVKDKLGYLEDVSYSGFNAAVMILPPKL